LTKDQQFKAVRWLLLISNLFKAALNIRAIVLFSQLTRPKGIDETGIHTDSVVVLGSYAIAFALLGCVAFLNIRPGWPYLRSRYTWLLVLGIILAFAWPSFHSFSPATQSVTTTEQVLVSCTARTHKQDCPASSQILSAPYFINGEIQGYLVYPGQDPDVFNSTGLKFGDLITEVAGQPLTDAKLLAEFFDNLSNGQSIQVMVVRRGEQEVIETHTD
jgi:hypothetical protein